MHIDRQGIIGIRSWQPGRNAPYAPAQKRTTRRKDGCRQKTASRDSCLDSRSRFRFYLRSVIAVFDKLSIQLYINYVKLVIKDIKLEHSDERRRPVTRTGL